MKAAIVAVVNCFQICIFVSDNTTCSCQHVLIAVL